MPQYKQLIIIRISSMSDDRIVLNIGGRYFQTYRSTLSGSSYFRSYFDRWELKERKKRAKPIFIDRSGDLFEHVLALLRNPDYPFSHAHKDELDFYGILYDEKKLWRPPYCKDCISVSCEKCNQSLCAGCRYTCSFCNESFCKECNDSILCTNHLCDKTCCASCSSLCANPDTKCHALTYQDEKKKPFCPDCIHDQYDDPKYAYCVYCCMEYSCRDCKDKQKSLLWKRHYR